MEQAEVAAFVSLQVGRRGLIPPGNATVERWYERLKDADRLTKEGIKQMLELHYPGEDFGARTKLVLLRDLMEVTGLSRHLLIKTAEKAGKVIKIGNRYYVTDRDREELFGD